MLVEQKHENRYSGSPESLRHKWRNRMMNMIPVVDRVLDTFKPHSVCDIGCGSGNFSEEFAKRGLTVGGVDVNPKMIQSIQKYVPDMDARIAPAEKLPFDDNTFDLAFMSFVLHEVDDQMKTLLEARRVARKGIAILDFPYDRVLLGPPRRVRIKPERLRAQCLHLGLALPEVVEYQKAVLFLIPTG